MRKKTFANKGMSMLEVLVTMAVITFTLIPLFQAIGIKLKVSTLLQKKITDSNVGDSMLEVIATKKWDENTVAANQFLPLLSCSTLLGPDAGESTEPDYDDIDDYNGYHDTAQGYNRNVAVEYVVVDTTTQSVAYSASRTISKRVTVTATLISNSTNATPYVRIFFDGVAN